MISWCYEIETKLNLQTNGTELEGEGEVAFFNAKRWDPRGGGALRCFQYRVCAAGQGIVFTILAPEPGIVFCKNAPKRVYSFKIFAPRQDYSVFS